MLVLFVQLNRFAPIAFKLMQSKELKHWAASHNVLVLKQVQPFPVYDKHLVRIVVQNQQQDRNHSEKYYYVGDFCPSLGDAVESASILSRIPYSVHIPMPGYFDKDAIKDILVSRCSPMIRRAQITGVYKHTKDFDFENIVLMQATVKDNIRVERYIVLKTSMLGRYMHDWAKRSFFEERDFLTDREKFPRRAFRKLAAASFFSIRVIQIYENSHNRKDANWHDAIFDYAQNKAEARTLHLIDCMLKSYFYTLHDVSKIEDYNKYIKMQDYKQA